MVKVFGISKTLWSVFFIFVHIGTIVFIALAMAHDYWFHQNWDVGNSSGKYKGYLFGPKTGIDGICDDDGDTYDDCYDNCKDYFESYSVSTKQCDRFDTWKKASNYYLVFSVIAIVFNGVSIFILIIDSIFKTRLKTIFNVFIPGLSMLPILLCHLLAFSLWSGTVDLKFDGCSHDAYYSGSKSVCGEGGVYFAIFILIFLFVISPVYIFISWKVRKAEKAELANQGDQGLIYSNS